MPLSKGKLIIENFTRNLEVVELKSRWLPLLSLSSWQVVAINVLEFCWLHCSKLYLIIFFFFFLVLFCLGFFFCHRLPADKTFGLLSLFSWSSYLSTQFHRYKHGWRESAKALERFEKQKQNDCCIWIGFNFADYCDCVSRQFSYHLCGLQEFKTSYCY